MIDKPEQVFPIPVETKNATNLFLRIADEIRGETVVLLQVARLKVSQLPVLYSLPGCERYLPVLRLLYSKLSSFISYGRSDMPLTVGIETIASCTRQCPYCTVSQPEFAKSRKETVMADETYQKIIDQLAQLPRKGKGVGFNGILHLHGFGEPLLDKKIVERVKSARQKLPEAIIGFHTNGDLLTEEKFLQLADAGINEIIITPHEGQFSDKILQLKAKYRSLKIIKLNKPLTAFSNRAGQLNIPAEQQQKPLKRCVHPTFALEITADGRIIVCSNDSLVTEPMGSIAQSSLMEIWQDPQYRKLRYALRHGRTDQLPQICTQCRSTRTIV